MILNICMKFQEDISNSFHVKQRHNFVIELLRRHYELVSTFTVVLKPLLHQGLSELEFYGDLVYKYRKM